jgi:16S rRNA processing protein RimM
VASPSRAGQRVCVGRIGAAHGVRGEVKLWSYTSDPAAIAQYGALESEDGARTFTIEALRPAKDFLVARLAGVTDRNAAERLRNIDLYIPRERLPPTEDDEYYHADLVGLAAVTGGGEPVGTVVALHNFGAGDLIELRIAGDNATVMLPFDTTVVPMVDIAGGRIVVDPPADTSRATARHPSRLAAARLAPQDDAPKASPRAKRGSRHPGVRERRRRPPLEG